MQKKIGILDKKKLNWRFSYNFSIFIARKPLTTSFFLICFLIVRVWAYFFWDTRLSWTFTLLNCNIFIRCILSYTICWYFCLSWRSFVFYFWASSNYFFKLAILLSIIGICWSIWSIETGAEAASAWVFLISAWYPSIWFFKSSICFWRLSETDVQFDTCLSRSFNLTALGDLVFST